MRARSRLVIVATGALLVPASASAATTIGSVDGSYTSLTATMAPQTIVLGDSASASFAAPSGGVITSISARVSGPLTVAFLRGPIGTGARVVGKVAFAGTDAKAITTSPARLAVQAGDRLGAEVVPTTQKIALDVAGSGRLDYIAGGLPEVGATLTVPTGANPGWSVAIAAQLEADADGDGYGDESQDACPADLTVHSGLCPVDLAVAAQSATAIPGATTVVTADLSIRGSADSSAAKVTVGIPSGVELLGLGASAGECLANVCTFPATKPGNTRRVYAIVRATAAGTYALPFAASAPEPTLNPADDIASATLTVSAAQPLSATALCTVPKLKGLTRPTATAKLAAAGCALGKVTGAKRAKGKGKLKVRTQTIPTGTRVAAGTKIGVRLG